MQITHSLSFFFSMFFLLCTTGYSQIAFNYFNQRNHPELKWQMLETRHIQIIYHQGLKETALEAAEIAEDCYRTITANLGHTPDRKIPIYISDQDEIANGFDLADRYIVIWVNVHNYFEHSTGQDKWLRKVIAHELVHYIHFSAISTWLGFLGQSFSRTPRWFSEGLAQYQSETWNVHRGDLVLRTRIVEDEMNYASLAFPSDGEMLYAAGNSAVRYLAEKYGDQKLNKILTSRNKFILPYYEFQQAFTKSIGKSPSAFYEEWRKKMNVYYNAVYAQKEELEEFAVKLKLPFEYVYDLRISPDSTWFGVVGTRSLDEPIRQLCLVKISKPQEIKILDRSNILPGISFTHDSQHIVYAKFHRGKNASIIPDIFCVDLKGRTKPLTHNLCATTPDCSPVADEFVCTVNEKGTANLFLVNLITAEKTKITHFTGDAQLARPRWSPDGKRIAFAFSDSTGQRDLALLTLENQSVYKFTNDDFDDRNPIWLGDNQTIAFTSYRTGIPNIFAQSISPENPNAESVRQLTDAAQGLYTLDGFKHSVAALVFDSQKSQSIWLIKQNRSIQANSIQIREKYERWQQHRPPHGIPSFAPPSVLTPDSVGHYSYNSFKNIQHYLTIPIPCFDVGQYGISLISYWAEPLGKHNFLAWGDFVLNNPNQSQYIISYLNNQFHPSIQLSLFQYPLEAQFFENEFLIEEKTGVSLDFWFPFNAGQNLDANHSFKFGVNWIKNHPYLPEMWDNRNRQPESMQIGELSLGYIWRFNPPNHSQVIHPLHAKGFQFQICFSNSKWKSELNYSLLELDSYTHFELNWLRHVLFLRTRFQALFGRLPVQRQIGFDKYDQLDFGFNLPLGDRERLRGIQEYRFGNRVIFSNLEYRFPLMNDLGWRLAGFSFTQVTGAVFMDLGSVWNSSLTTYSKIQLMKTAGFELKNCVNLIGFGFVHSAGLAWNLSLVSRPEKTFYYRIRAVVPF